MILILDQFLSRPGQGEALHDLYISDYVPGAKARGMTLQRVMVSPPFWDSEGASRLLFLWSVPDSHGFWRKNNLGRRDPDVHKVWARIEALAESRRRDTLAHPADFTALAGG